MNSLWPLSLIALASCWLGNAASAAEPALPVAEPRFNRHIVPLFSRLGCNAGACHGAVQGRNGFRLSLFGHNPTADHVGVVRDFGGRRLDFLNPDASLLLLKATGRLLHEGGKRMEVGSPEYQLLRNWITSGAPLDSVEQAQVKKLTVTPAEHSLKPGEGYQLRVEVTFADGLREDVTALCTFESRDTSVVEAESSGRVKAVGVGRGAVLVRFRGEPALGVAFVPASATGTFPAVQSNNFIDTQVFDRLRRLNLQPSEMCDDVTFLRRVALDVTGALPTPEEVRAFLADKNPDRRSKKIDELLNHPGYAALWATRFCDLLKPQFKEDNRSWAEPAYQRRFYEWLRARFQENTRYDELVERIVLATSQDGRSKEEMHQELAALAEEDAALTPDLKVYGQRRSLDLYWMRANATGVPGTIQFAHAFLGLRMQCAQCHRHPTDVWQQDDLISFANFFTRLTRETEKLSPAEQKKLNEEKKTLDALIKKLRTQAKDKKLGKDVAMKLLAEAAELERKGKARVRLNYLRTKFSGLSPSSKGTFASVTSPLGKYESQAFRLLGEAKPLTPPAGQDPRKLVMDWLRRPDHPFFAKAIVNRVWANYFGRALIDPPDDLSPLNPPTHPELLAELCRQFVANKYDLKWLHKTILSSRAYQLSSNPTATNKHDRANYARHYVRRLRAEVLIDAINHATASQETYPEGSYLPAGAKALEVPGMSSFSKDGGGKISAASLDYAFQIFGRSQRDVETQCDCETDSDPSLVQSLYLAAYGDLLKKVSDPNGRAAQLLKLPTEEKRVEEAFLWALSRFPTASESQTFVAHLRAAPTPQKGMEDVLWVLVNSKEFQLNR